jgi:hypothetical protein
MMTEIYELWSEYNNYNIPVDRYYVIDIHQDLNTLELTIHNEDDSIEIILSFDERIETFRSTPESNLLSTIGDLCAEVKNFSGTPDFIYTVKNSKLIDWLRKEGMETYSFNEYYNACIHYSIITVESVTDIVTSGVPKITIRKLSID